MALYQGGVDPLIADVMMPTMDGFTMVKEMRAAGFEQPVLMLTAKTTITDKTTGFTSGADDYLTKPVDLAELKLRVAALCAGLRLTVPARLQSVRPFLTKRILL